MSSCFDEVEHALRALAYNRERNLNPPEVPDVPEYFQKLSREEQDQEMHRTARLKPYILQEVFCDWVKWSDLFKAWIQKDAGELYRIFDNAMRDGLEGEINEARLEYEREVFSSK